LIKFICITFLACSLFLAGCSGINQPDSSGTAAPGSTNTAKAAYPAPTEFSTGNLAYPAPGGGTLEANYATPGPIPTPGTDSGTVVGTILVNGKPVGNLMIYLGEVLADDQGVERVASYGRSSSPRAYTNSEGRFVFSEIELGKYGLILDTVLSSFLLFEPDGEDPLLVQVTANEQADVGEIDYDELPIPESP
jgi:hypothetical protein